MKDRLLGTWKLVKFELRDLNNNTIHPFGDDVTGICMFDRSGYSSAQCMRNDRSKFASESPTPEEMQAAFASYLSYYGKVSINEKNCTFTTHVEGSLNPNWVGTDQLRYFEFSDSNLILGTPPMQLGGIEFTGKFIWAKVG